MAQKFEWRKSFELGVPEIDGDHRTMLELMRAFRTAAEARDRRCCEQYLDRFVAFTRSHFAREEALLEEWGYSGVEAHARYHAGLVERAQEVRRTCAGIETPEEFETCCEEMMSFLVDDVIRGDLKLKSFIEESGLSLRA